MRAFKLLSVLAVCVLLACATGVEAGRHHHKSHTIARAGAHAHARAHAVQAEQPAPATLKSYIHQSSLVFIESMASKIIENLATNLSLPATSLDIVGGYVNITDLVLSRIIFDANDIALIGPNQVQLTISDVQGDIDLSWAYHSLLTFSGKAHVDFNHSTLVALFTLGSDAAGRPDLKMDSLKMTINDLNVNIQDGVLGWLVTLLVKLFKGLLVPIIEGEIQSKASGVFNSILNSVMTHWPLKVDLNAAGLANMELVTAMVPLVDGQAEAAVQMVGNYVVSAFEFAFDSTTNSTVDPRPRVMIPVQFPKNAAGTEPMLGLTVSESLLGSLLYTFAQNGKLNLGPFSNKDLPADSFIQLNTGMFMSEWPTLYKKYPRNNITLSVVPFNGPPSVSVSPAGLNVADLVVLEIAVIDPTQANPIVQAAQLLLNVTVQPSLFAVFQNDTGVFVNGKIAPVNVTTEVLWAVSDPGTLAAGFGKMLNVVINAMALPSINAQLANGFKVLGSKLEVFPIANPLLVFGDRTISIGMDVHMPTQVEAQEDAVDMLDDFRQWE